MVYGQYTTAKGCIQALRVALCIRLAVYHKLPRCLTVYLYKMLRIKGSKDKMSTLGDRRSPLLQLVSILCCLMYAHFQGLWVKPGLVIFLFLKARGSSMPACGEMRGEEQCQSETASERRISTVCSGHCQSSLTIVQDWSYWPMLVSIIVWNYFSMFLLASACACIPVQWFLLAKCV